MKNNPQHLTLDRRKFTNLIVVSGTASGKTTVAYQLSKVLGFGFLDLDLWIEKRVGLAISELVAQQGIEGFRLLEREAIEGLQGILNHVIVAGAGATENQDNWDALKKLGPSLWLATPMSEVIHRLMQDPEELQKRPMLSDALTIDDKKAREAFLVERLGDLEKSRSEKYRQADYAVTIGFATAETCAQFIKHLLIQDQVS